MIKLFEYCGDGFNGLTDLSHSRILAMKKKK